LDHPVLEALYFSFKKIKAMCMSANQCLNCEKLVGGELFNGRSPTKIVV